MSKSFLDNYLKETLKEYEKKERRYDILVILGAFLQFFHNFIVIF